MAKHVKRSVLPIYLVGFFWLGYALLFSLRSAGQYLLCAALSGVVITVKRLDYSYGYYVMIYHGTDAQGRSVVTLYAHNSRILVSPGQTVKKGEAIAKSGSTGNSTGPHSHFEVRLNGSRVNPKNYLS